MFNKSAVLCSLLTLLVVVTPYIALADTASTTPTLDPHNQTDVEEVVRGYFADVPVMAAIAKCESNFRQFNDAGGVLNGGSGGMIGVFQVNRSVHAKFALTLGDDINTLAGNMAYARYLYGNEGTAPWDSSKDCWGGVALPAAKAVVAEVLKVATDAILPSGTTAHASTVADAPTPVTLKLSNNLKLGSVGPQVVALQKLLNGAGYKVAKTGDGSPGQESTTFGPATKAAVQRFQCAQIIVCKGSESTTGYGFVGAKTRSALMLNS